MMQAFLTLPDDERRAAFEAAVPELGLPAVSVERDLWVTWTLHEMFALEEWGPHFTFKGGTSLSKCWKLSRHYHDLHRLVERGVGAAAAAETGLLERVVAHRRVFFRYAWMDYATMQRGSLRLAPLPAQESDWRRDYEAMRGEMFFGELPTFDDVLTTVRRFETEVNRV